MNEPVEFDPIVLEVRSKEPEWVADRAWAAGASGIEERPDDLRITFPDHDTAAAAAPLLAAGGHVVDVSATLGNDWVASWRPHARVTEEPPFVVRPPWLDRIDRGPGDGTTIDVVIDPGPTFGHGAHATTRLLLRTLPTVVSSSTSVLDVGCGSGVLAIASAHLGSPSVTAIDVDPVAVTVTVDNAARNGVAVDASTRPLATITDRFDVVVVNLTAAVMAGLAPHLGRVTSGCLLASGLLAGQTVAGLEGLEVIDEQDGWVCCVLRCD